jgi:hypothetical protein
MHGSTRPLVGEVASTSRRHRPQDDSGADQQEGNHPRTVEGLEPGKSYTANGERVEDGAHRSNLRQIAEDARIAGQAAVGQTADHDIAGKKPKAGGNRRDSARRSLIAVRGGQFLRSFPITRKRDDKAATIRSGATITVNPSRYRHRRRRACRSPAGANSPSRHHVHPTGFRGSVGQVK